MQRGHRCDQITSEWLIGSAFDLFQVRPGLPQLPDPLYSALASFKVRTRPERLAMGPFKRKGPEPLIFGRAADLS